MALSVSTKNGFQLQVEKFFVFALLLIFQDDAQRHVKEYFLFYMNAVFSASASASASAPNSTSCLGNFFLQLFDQLVQWNPKTDQQLTLILDEKWLVLLEISFFVP